MKKKKEKGPSVWSFYTEESDLPYTARYKWDAKRFLALAADHGTTQRHVTLEKDYFTVDLWGTLDDGHRVQLTRDIDREEVEKLVDGDKAILRNIVRETFIKKNDKDREAARQVASRLGLGSIYF